MLCRHRNINGRISIYGTLVIILAFGFANSIHATAKDNVTHNSTILLTGIQQITAGGYFTCILTTAGGVRCWGDNHFGQLGNGTKVIFSHIPVNVVDLSTDIRAISAGIYHVCALTNEGSVKCWGKNVSGQLGNGTYEDSSVPVDVIGLTNVTAISAGSSHTCALTTKGGIQCWGNGLYGKLGNGERLSSSSPTEVIKLSTGIRAIAAGGSHTCALTTEGGVKCWGYNFHGEVGDGTHIDQDIPVDVTALTTGALAIAVGTHHSCALTMQGIKCWGYNQHGQLGDGSQTNRTTPINVVDFTEGGEVIVAGGFHTCAVTTTGGVKCWGENGVGELGDGTQTSRLTPTDVTDLSSDVNVITTGVSHTCVLMTNGLAKCWGYNIYGEVGDGTRQIRSTPVDLTLPIGVKHSLYLPLVQS
ncbi:MAG TPA: hypothetical protein P5121_07730 [Caldilineaceae bacterium]|nr:hypothetical protein [Caldilineaceae bacterium]